MQNDKGRTTEMLGSLEKVRPGELRLSAPEDGEEQLTGLRGGTLRQGEFSRWARQLFSARFFRAFFVVGMFVSLFPLALPSSSSEADNIAPWRSALDLDRLWGGVLGCADAGDDEEAVKNALAGDSVPEGAQRDYLDCGTRALRAAASRMLVNTIEDSLRWGGSLAFDQEFRLDSSLTWEFGGDFRGELDTILPIGGVLNSDGTGRALFFQQGITFWEGRGNELRSDSNTGLVYRGHVSRDWILGGSFFFDYNFQREHTRLSVGVDAQHKNFYGGLNYYFTPSGREWRRGRGGYEERVLEGWDLHWSFVWEELRLSGAFGTWIFDGEGPGRRQSVSVSAGYMVYPGVFLEAGYEYHDDRSVDEDWNVGLAFRYSLPDMGGIGGSRIGSGRVPDLWRVVDRERRILYEERLARTRVRATLTALPGRVEEGDDVTVRVVLGEELEEDVFFSVVAASSSTAAADDHNNSLPLSVTIPAGALSAEETFRIANDGDPEPDEILDLELKVLQESFFLVTRGNSHRARVVIVASDNSIVGFATESTSVIEGIKVDIPLALGEPAPASGLVLAASTDNLEEATTDEEVRISPGVQSGQYIRVTANADDDVPEHADMVRITLSEPEGGLPEGWRIGRREHMLMILPHGFNIAFGPHSSEVHEHAGIVDLVLVLNGPAPAGLVLNVSSNLVEDAVPVRSTLTVAEGVQRVELPVRVIDDQHAEGDEVATISISGTGGGPMPEGWSIGQQFTHALTIKDNDLAVGFEHSSSQVRESDRTTNLRIVLSEVGAPAGGMSLTVTAEGNEDNDISFTSPVTILEGEKEKILTVTLAQDEVSEGAERIVLTLSGQLPESWNYGQTTHELTILPNENEVAFERPSTAVNEGIGTVNVALELNHPAPEGLVLAFDSSSPDDAVPASPTLQVPAGATSATLVVNIKNDDIGELGETVTISISGSSPTVLPEGWSIGSQDTHDLIVTDDDLAVGFESASSQVRESELTTDLAIVLSGVGAPTGGISLSVSATGNDDNDISFSSLLPISGGEKTQKLTVTLAQDDETEEDELIVLTLSGTLPEPWKFGQRTHELTILSNEQTAMFAEAGKTVDENVGTTSFKVELSKAAPAGGVPLQVAITSGNDSDDVTFTTQSFTIAEGQSERTINVTVNDDTLAEPDEVVTFTLTKGGGFPEEWGGLGTQTTFELTITDDDSATIGFTTTESVVTEGDTTATLTVEMSTEVSQEVEVTLTESGDGNNDLAFAPTSLTFMPGETRKEVVLTVNTANDDSGVEEDVEITYTLGGTFPGNVSLAAGRDEHVVTFVDDDSANVGFTTTMSTLTEGDTTATLTVLMSAEATQRVDVTLTEDGDTNSDLDFAPTSLTFMPGETRKEVVLTVNTANVDNIVEEGVEITYTLGGTFPGDVSLATGRDKHVVTFADDDSATIGFTTTESVVTEGDTTATKLMVRLNGSVSQDVAVAISESGDTNNDIDFLPVMLIFEPGETEEEVTLTVNAANDDALPEEDVEITYTLAAADTLSDSVTFDPREHVVTFVDDDKSVGFEVDSSSLVENTGDGRGEVSGNIVLKLNAPAPADGLNLVVSVDEESNDVGSNNDVNVTTGAGGVVSVSGGAREVLLPVMAVDDNIVEEDEPVMLTLSKGENWPKGWEIGSSGGSDFFATHTITILANDRTIGFANTLPAKLEEGTTGFPLDVVWNADISGQIYLGVVLEKDDDGDSNYDVRVRAGRNFFNEHEDSSHVELSYTGPAGSDQALEIHVRDDVLVEDAEDVVVRLVPREGHPLPGGWSVDPAEYSFTIYESDKVIGFESSGGLNLVEDTEDSRGKVSEDVVLKLNAPAPVGGLNLVVSISEETNDDGNNNDLNVTTDAGGVVSIPEGETDFLLPVMAVDDDIPESDEPVMLTLSKGENWPKGWEIGSSRGGDFFATHTATILGNDKKVGWSITRGFYVSEVNPLSAADVVTNYPAPTGGFRIDVAVAPYTGSYAQASVPGDLSFDEYLYIPGGSRETSGRVSRVVPTHDNIAEPDEAALFRLTLAGGGQLPPGWEWSNRDYEAIILANDNSFTLRDEQNRVEGSYSEGDTVRLTAVLTNPLPQLEPSQFIRRGRILVSAGEHSDDISITPVAPLIYHSAFHYPDGGKKVGREFGYFPLVVQREKAEDNIVADYVFSFSEGGLTSFSFDVAVKQDEELELPETTVIRMVIGSGAWGAGAVRSYTLTTNSEIGEGKIGFVKDPLTITEDSKVDTFMISHDPLPSPMTLRFSVHETEGTFDSFSLGDQTDELIVGNGGTLTFPAGISRFRIPIVVPDDYINEPDAMFWVQAFPVSVPAGYTLSPIGIRVLVPASDQDFTRIEEGNIGFVEDPLTVTEGSATTTFITTHDPLPAPMTLGFTFKETEGTLDEFTVGKQTFKLAIGELSDDIIVGENGRITFPAGSSTFEIPITKLDDDDTDSDEMFLLSIVPHFVPAGLKFIPGGARIRVPTNDNLVGFTPVETTFQGGREGELVPKKTPSNKATTHFIEGENGNTLLIDLTLTNPAPEGGLPLRILAVPGREAAFASPRSFTIMPEHGLKYTHEIPIEDDEILENTRCYDLVLEEEASSFPDSWGKLGGETSHRLCILQDDRGTVGFSSAVNEDPVVEGGSHDVTINLSNPVEQGLGASVNVTAVESDGDNEPDVRFKNGQTLTVGPGATELTVSLEIIDDELLEEEEEIVLHFSHENFPENTLKKEQGKETYTFKIARNDNIIEFKDRAIRVEEDVGTFSFTLKLTQPAPEGGLPLMLDIVSDSLGNSNNYATADDFILAEYGNPFTITPEDGLEYTFSITIVDNDGPEAMAESIRFVLTPGDGFPDDWGAVASGQGGRYSIWIEANDS